MDEQTQRSFIYVIDLKNNSVRKQQLPIELKRMNTLSRSIKDNYFILKHIFLRITRYEQQRLDDRRKKDETIKTTGRRRF